VKSEVVVRHWVLLDGMSGVPRRQQDVLVERSERLSVLDPRRGQIKVLGTSIFDGVSPPPAFAGEAGLARWPKAVAAMGLNVLALCGLRPEVGSGRS